MKAHFKDIVASELTRNELTQTQLKSLHKLISSDRKKRWHEYSLTAARACAAGLILAVILWPSLVITPFAKKVAREVREHYPTPPTKLIASPTFAGLNSSLNRLPFTITRPQAVWKNSWVLRGGKYCSLDENVAAQIKIDDSITQETFTLYQVKDSAKWKKFFGELKKQSIGAVDVFMWREQGLFMAIAGPLGSLGVNR